LRRRIDLGADYGPLNPAARGKIDLERVRRHWPDIRRLVASIHIGAVSAHDVIRMLAPAGNPSQLGDALALYGRIFKTLHVLTYVDDEPYRREIKTVRNLQERRHDLARYVFHGRKGLLRPAYQEGMEDQLGALGLVLNATRYGTPTTSTPPSPRCAPTATPSVTRTSRACRYTCAATSTSTATTPSSCPTSPAPTAHYVIPTAPTTTTDQAPDKDVQRGGWRSSRPLRFAA